MRLKMRSASHRESECSEAGRPSSSKKEGSCPSFCSASKISSRSVFSTRLVFVPIGGRRRTGKANAARPDGHPAQKRKARARVSAALRRSLRGRSFRRAWSSCRSEVGVAPGKRMQRGRTAIQLKKGRLVPEFLQRFEDLFAVGLFDALGLRALLAPQLRTRTFFLLVLIPLLSRCGNRVFVPDVVQQRDFQFRHNLVVSSRLSASFLRAIFGSPTRPLENPPAGRSSLELNHG